MHPIKHSLTRLWTNTATIQEGDLCEERAACVRTSASERTSERAKLVSQSQTLLQCECVRRRSVQFARSLSILGCRFEFRAAFLLCCPAELAAGITAKLIM